VKRPTGRPPKPRRRRKPDEIAFGVRIVYEDDTVIVIDKPAGLLSVATLKETERTAFKVVREYLTICEQAGRRQSREPVSRSRGAYLGVVHRLDRETSGIMFFVKNNEARLKLTQNWMSKVHTRTYLAVLEGKPKESEGTISNWLKQNKALMVYAQDHPGDGAEPAVTRYKVVRDIEAAPGPNGKKRCLVELTLETGRTNQIRVHMAGLGCPIVGDKKYGSGKGRDHLALHAKLIAFEHPDDDRLLTFESPLPPEMRRLLKGDSPAVISKPAPGSPGT
jgi:23S rRNA pseudouridine1911/1915/1917 synthase